MGCKNQSKPEDLIFILDAFCNSFPFLKRLQDVVEEIIPEDAAAEIADLEPDLEEALAELGDDHQFGEIEGDVLAELAAPLEEEVTRWLETNGKTGVQKSQEAFEQNLRLACFM